MEAHRNGEKGNRIPQRAPRFFKRGTSWYIATREAPIGPYQKLSDAVSVSKDYLCYLEHAPKLEDVARLA